MSIKFIFVAEALVAMLAAEQLCSNGSKYILFSCIAGVGSAILV
jgi:hypothetical protein